MNLATRVWCSFRESNSRQGGGGHREQRGKMERGKKREKKERERKTEKVERLYFHRDLP